MSLIEQLGSAQKEALRAKEKVRLGAIRMTLAEIKQREIDDKVELNDDDVIQILTKLIKQRKDSIQQFNDAGRSDLAEIEQAEVEALSAFLPQALSDDEIMQMVNTAVSEVEATGMQAMGQVMAKLKPQMVGRADMASVSGIVKAILTQ